VKWLLQDSEKILKSALRYYLFWILQKCRLLQYVRKTALSSEINISRYIFDFRTEGFSYLPKTSTLTDKAALLACPIIVSQITDFTTTLIHEWMTSMNEWLQSYHSHIYLQCNSFWMLFNFSVSCNLDEEYLNVINNRKV